MTGHDAVDAAYEALVLAAGTLDEATSWHDTECSGWSARDLLFHCLMDAQRALVALHTPTGSPADRTAVTYWEDWIPDPVGAANGRRFVRVAGSMFLHFDQLRDLFADTMNAVRHAARHVPDEQRVRTQGHVLTCGDLLTTLAVEATLHHLDLLRVGADLPEPSPEGLAEARSTVEGLLGLSLPTSWNDAHCARVCTGRAGLSDVEREVLGASAAALPLFA